MRAERFEGTIGRTLTSRSHGSILNAVRDADAATTNKLQIFENGGSRARGAVQPGQRHVRVQRPCRPAAGDASFAHRPVVERGSASRRAAARRPWHRAVRRPASPQLAPSGEPSLRVPHADVTHAGPGIRRRRGSQLRPYGSVTRTAGDEGVLYATDTVNSGFSFFVGSPVSARYSAPFAFRGTLHEIVIQANPEKFSDNDAIRYTAEMARQ